MQRISITVNTDANSAVNLLHDGDDKMLSYRREPALQSAL